MDHHVREPEWVIKSSGLGAFRVTCACGWVSRDFDLAAMAREAGDYHQAGAIPVETSTEQPAPKRRRWPLTTRSVKTR